MTDPTVPDFINAAFAIWNADDESDVYISLRDDHDIECDNPDDGAWVTGARVWISREQLDAYLLQQQGKGPGPELPCIQYMQPDPFDA
jgi:hypothetical protein